MHHLPFPFSLGFSLSLRLTLALSFVVTLAFAQQHTEFVRLPLTLSPEEMMQQLEEKGLQREDSCSLSGRIAGLDVWLHVEANRDTTGCSHIMVTTQEQQGHSRNHDYKALKKWLCKHYGNPTWESTVRSHPFARWFIDFDHDIVLISKATTATEVWFYENHRVRDFDYYAILKCCERMPLVDGIPYYTAQEQVTWENKPVVLPKPKVSKKQKKSRKHHKTKHHKKRRRR